MSTSWRDSLNLKGTDLRRYPQWYTTEVRGYPQWYTTEVRGYNVLNICILLPLTTRPSAVQMLNFPLLSYVPPSWELNLVSSSF